MNKILYYNEDFSVYVESYECLPIEDGMSDEPHKFEIKQRLVRVGLKTKDDNIGLVFLVFKAEDFKDIYEKIGRTIIKWGIV